MNLSRFFSLEDDPAESVDEVRRILGEVTMGGSLSGEGWVEERFDREYVCGEVV